jgi:hypothetical protein
MGAELVWVTVEWKDHSKRAKRTLGPIARTMSVKTHCKLLHCAGRREQSCCGTLLII